MYVCMSVCVFVCLPVGLSVSVCLFVCVCLLPLSTNPSLSRPLSISACMSLSHLCLSVSAPCPSMCICHSLSFSMYVGPVCMYVCLFLSLSLSTIQVSSAPSLPYSSHRRRFQIIAERQLDETVSSCGFLSPTLLFVS